MINRRNLIRAAIVGFTGFQWAIADLEAHKYAIGHRPRDLTSTEPPDDEAAKEELGEDGIVVNGRLVPGMTFHDIQNFAKDWRPAASRLVFRDQINAMAPKRRKHSDGVIGDAAHASRKSDHNPWIIESNVGVVSAIDITNDRAAGCDVAAIVERLRSRKDSRLKYVIWNGQIFNSKKLNGSRAWDWRPYTGSNSHSHHMHMSVKSSKEFYDSQFSWSIA